MLDFESVNGTITCNGERVHIKGTNWFGLETDTYSLHGLWSVSFESVIKFLADNKFNALRIPLSVELIDNMATAKIKSINTSANPTLADMTIEAFLEHLLKACADAGILVMFDLHLLKASAPIPELWCDGGVDEAHYTAAWLALVARFQEHWNFFACDLNNEPHGCATWGDGAHTDWRAAAERIGNAILGACPRLLIFVEGIDGRGMDDSWWGGYLALAHPERAPVNLSVPNRLVYSPHVYGPDVFFKDMFKAPEFPHNMPEIWHRQWSYVKLDGIGPAVVIGEWGGKAADGSPDLTWQRALAEYLAAHDITDHFYWCVNPNSGDTGGLLADDWATPNATKLQLIDVACPAPTSFAGGQPQNPAPEAKPLPWESVLGDAAAATPAPMVPPLLPAAGATAGAPAEPAPGGAEAATPAAPAAPVGAPCTDAGALTITPTVSNSWEEGGEQHEQHDVVVVNKGAGGVGAGLRLAVSGAEVAKIWNVEPAADGAGYVLPGWLLQNGGLQPGASFNFGCITCKGAAAFGASFV